MLEQGAGTRSALALSDEYEALGADHAAGCDWDSCVVRAKVLASRLDGALDRVADVALRPTFDGAEIERLRQRWLGSLKQEKNSPPAMAQNALAAAVFGRQHPYGHALRGQPGDVEQLTSKDVVERWNAAFAPAVDDHRGRRRRLPRRAPGQARSAVRRLARARQAGRDPGPRAPARQAARRTHLRGRRARRRTVAGVPGRRGRAVRRRRIGSRSG